VLYMIKPGVAERLEQFVAGGGTLAVTYWTGIVDENDLCFLGGFPGPLRNLLGVWCEETDAYYPHQKNAAVFADGTSFDCGFLADILHEETAEVIAKFRDDFYAGAPAVTKNAFGCGAAWYLASRFAVADLAGFYRARVSEAGITPLLSGFGAGVQVVSRAGFLFVLNFSGDESWADLPACEEITTGERFQGRTVLDKNASLILRRL
jgi:beta-galactosidase